VVRACSNIYIDSSIFEYEMILLFVEFKEHINGCNILTTSFSILGSTICAVNVW
jgi:hypothetical protein